MPQRRKPTKKPVKSFAWTNALTQYVKEYKCPDCKSYALYVLELPDGESVVRCRKCGYRLDLERFARTVMQFEESEEGAVIRIPDFLGGPDKVVTLPPLDT